MDFEKEIKDIILIDLDNDGLVREMSGSAASLFNEKDGEAFGVGDEWIHLLESKGMSSLVTKRLIASVAQGPGDAEAGVLDLVTYSDGAYQEVAWRVLKRSRGVVLVGSKVDMGNHSTYLNTILDNMPHSVFWKNKDSVFLGCNQAFCNIAGLRKPGEIVGRTDFDMPWGEHEAKEYIKDDNEVMSSGKANLNIEETQTNEKGEAIFLSTNKIPMRNEVGEVIGVLVICSDITEKKNQEIELKNSKAEAEEASEAKSEFIANMSHDLRTPMTGVMGMLTEIECLAEDLSRDPAKLDEVVQEIKEYAGVGKGSAEELLALFNEIIKTIKLESGQEEVEDIHFSLTSKIDKAIGLLRSTATDKSLELKKQVDTNIPDHFQGGGGYLDRILVNLLSNALKFTKEGSVEIGASLVSSGPSQVGDEVMVRITVADTGIGIPEDKFDSIFEHFSRLNPSYEGKYKGNGLGLYAVKRYVEGMGGAISVESEEGKGSKFIVDLPFKVSDHSDREEAVEPIPPLPDETKERSNRKASQQPEIDKTESTPDNQENSVGIVAQVLVVEDNLAAAMSIKRSLKRLGCNPDHAKTGEESVEFAEKNKYDIVFMDIGLPGISGLEATKQIRDFSSVPIVAVSGHANKSGDCIDAGMQELLVKPATPSSLEAMLNRHVHSKNEGKNKINDSETILDWPCSIKMHDNDEEVTREVLDHVYEGLIESEKIIDAAYAQKNIMRLREEIHKVKGGVCYLRLPQLERALNGFHLTLKESPIVPENMGKEYQKLKIAIKNFKEAYEKDGYWKTED